MNVGSPLLWSVFTALVAVALFVDFFVMARQGAHRVSLREATVWSAIWVLVSLVFCAGLWAYLEYAAGDALADRKALEFITGYVIEKALAVDNIFVFLLVFTYFGVPLEFQKRVLMIGIIGALVLRIVLILIGAWLLARFHWILYLFGAFLLYTGVRMWTAGGESPDLENNPALRFLRRYLRIAPAYEGERLTTRLDGRLAATPLAVVVLLIGIVDVIFAVDSIPAIFAITLDPFIVVTSNVFAVLGLRALFFLLAGVHERFHLLSYGLAIVLAFIGVKMLIVDFYKIPVLWSLLFTVSVLVIATVASLVFPPRGEPGSAYPFRPREGD